MTLDMEAILHDYLEDILDVKVVGSTPKTTSEAWVQVTQLDDRAVGQEDADYFHNYHLQLDCYAGVNGSAGQGEAQALYSETRAALVAMRTTDLEDATVTAVRFGACPRIPDDAFEPARQRYIIDAHIYAH